MIRIAVALAAALLLTGAGEPRSLRIWGPAAMHGIVARWADAYRRQHPDVAIELTMRGSDTAIPGLYGGRADIALMGRANDVVDDNGFSRTLERKIVRLPLTAGALAAPGKSDALALLVHADNPLRSLSFAQLRAAFVCDSEGPPRTWLALGVAGPIATRPIAIYGYGMASRTGRWFQDTALGGSRKLCWRQMTEFDDAHRSDGTMALAAERIADAASGDRAALLLANVDAARDGWRVVAIVDGGGRPVLPTAATVSDGSYPLARRTYAFVDRKPGSGIDPLAADFLRFALGGEGQALLADDRGGYLPLSRDEAAAARTTLDTR